MQIAQRKVMVVGGCHTTKYMFNAKGWACVHNVAEADLVCFTGGADVDPALYDHPKHHSTFIDQQRDAREMAVLEAAVGKNTPVVGICRGGQFLNVMNGGTMYQDVTGHTYQHELIIGAVNSERKIHVTSTHHQMMKPGASGRVLAWGPKSTVTEWCHDANKWVTKDLEYGVEVVMYDNALCFQPHPEMMMGVEKFDDMRKYFFGLIETLFVV